MERPNFLIIITDQFHPRCLGYAGHPVVRTENIDRLASRGMNFTRMYTSQPLCMPARATLFTGLTPRGHRVRMNGIPLDPAIPTFTQALAENGYRTHCCGKIHLRGQIPKGTKASDHSPQDFPEATQIWAAQGVKEFPLPYYGLQGVDYIGGHGTGTFGHYTDWLDKEHPDKAHLFHDAQALEPKNDGFTLFNRALFKWALPAELHPAAWITDRTIDFLNQASEEQRKTPDKAKPFCLLYSIQDPHSPFAAPDPYCRRYNPEDVVRPLSWEGELEDMPPHFKAMYKEDIVTSGNNGEAMKRTEPYALECIAQYYGLIEMIDDQVGRVMDTLENTGMDKNTVVMFLADHGECLGDHGMWGKGPYHYDGVIRVPFIVHWPKRFTPSRVHSGPVSFTDIAPTILELAGVPIPEGPTPPVPETTNAPPPWPGRSLVPILEGADTNCDTSALVEMDEDYLNVKMRTLVTERYRLTHYSGREYGELFDLQEDPEEYYNLWNRKEYRNLRNALRIQLLDKIMQTDISLPRQLSRS